MYRQIGFLFVFAGFICKSYGDFYIDNFQKYGDPSSWTEHSDTVVKAERGAEGKSKANFVLLKTQIFERAVLFTMLNPQMCGAAFAGVMKDVSLDVSNYTTISLRIKGQGQYRGYEFILRHRGQGGADVPTYVQYFKAPTDFDVVRLPLKHFKLYQKGKLLEIQEPLDETQVTTLGILAYGGRHLQKKQSGVAALEIDWIKLEQDFVQCNV